MTADQLLDTAEIKKEYTYGMNDATLYVTDKGFFVYDGLRVATSHFDTFAKADGMARMIVALNR